MMKPRRLRILFIQPGTNVFAGIERVVDSVCNGMANKYGNDIDISVLYTSEHINFPKEARKYSTEKHLASTRWKLWSTYRRVIKAGRYDLVVVPQIEPTVLVWLACLGLKQRFAMHLHGNPRKERTNIKSAILFVLMKKLVLARLAAVFGTSPKQLQAFRHDFSSDIPDAWLPNPVRTFDPPVKHVSSKKKPHIVFLSIGRFSIQKGQDLLIEAFFELFKRRQDIRLRLVGHGATEQSLRSQINLLGLTDVVSLEYHPDNPQEPLRSSDIFIATSRWEGWSLAICEALRCGLPVISLDCDFGPSDILVDPRLGILVPPSSRTALVEAMNSYCEDLATQKTFAEFRQANIAQYDVEKVIDVHAQIILKVARG